MMAPFDGAYPSILLAVHTLTVDWNVLLAAVPAVPVCDKTPFTYDVTEF
jgi:hypothetical protein